MMKEAKKLPLFIGGCADNENGRNKFLENIVIYFYAIFHPSFLVRVVRGAMCDHQEIKKKFNESLEAFKKASEYRQSSCRKQGKKNSSSSSRMV